MIVAYRNCLQVSGCVAVEVVQLSFFIFRNGGLKKSIHLQIRVVSNQVHHSVICFRNLRNKSEFQFSVI